MHHNTIDAMVKMLLEMTSADEVVRNSNCDCDGHRWRTCDSWLHIIIYIHINRQRSLYHYGSIVGFLTVQVLYRYMAQVSAVCLVEWSSCAHHRVSKYKLHFCYLFVSFKTNLCDYYTATDRELRKVAVPVDCFDCFKCTNDVSMDLSTHQQCIDKYFEDIVKAVTTADCSYNSMLCIESFLE